MKKSNDSVPHKMAGMYNTVIRIGLHPRQRIESTARWRDWIESPVIEAPEEPTTLTNPGVEPGSHAN